MFTNVNSMVPAAIALAALVVAGGCGKQTEVTTSTEATSHSASEPDSLAAFDTSVRDQVGGRTERARPTRGTDAAPTLQDVSSADATTRQAREDRRAAAAAAREREAASRGGAEMSRPAVVSVEPMRLDVGQMPVRESRRGVVQLTNTSDTIVRLVDARPSCGCTVTDVPKNYDMQPGETVDVTVQLSGGARPERLTKSVTFVFEDHPNISMQVTGESIAYVSMTPPSIDPDSHPDGRIVLRSHDDEPFRVLDVHPLLAVDLPAEAATEHEIFISWDQWAELRQPRRIEITTDHPMASKIEGVIRAPRTPARADARTARTADQDRRRPADPRTGALHELASAGNTDALMQRIAAGAEVDSTDPQGMSLLGVAAHNAQIELMHALLEAGADVNFFSTTTGMTPLMSAALSKNAEAVSVLLDAGANVNARDMQLGNSALSWAAFHGNAETVQVLLDAGAEVEVVSRMISYTPLLWAAGWGETASVELLIEAGADVNVVCTTPKSASALMYAAETSRVGNVSALLKAGADTEVRDPQRRTALILAAANANLATVEALIEAGADPHVEDIHERTALDHARARDDESGPAIAALLERHVKN